MLQHSNPCSFSPTSFPSRPALRRVTKGMDVIHSLELLPTKREGIFVMPVDRITITNTYWYRAHGPLHLSLEGATSES